MWRAEATAKNFLKCNPPLFCLMCSLLYLRGRKFNQIMMDGLKLSCVVAACEQRWIGPSPDPEESLCGQCPTGTRPEPGIFVNTQSVVQILYPIYLQNHREFRVSGLEENHDMNPCAAWLIFVILFTLTNNFGAMKFDTQKCENLQ